MFILVVISDIIRIPPEDFNRETSGLMFQLELKYANKILHEVGLVIKVHDILSLGEAFIHPGDGASILTVKARLVVFRPFIGEVLTGKIKGSTEQGLVVSMHFFDHVFIPKENLPFPSTFDPNTWQWRWTYDATPDGDSGQSCNLWMELDSKIKFMVMDIVFTKTTVGYSLLISAEKKTGPINNNNKKDSAPVSNDDYISPMVVVGTLTENSNPLSGLGIPEWWTEATTVQTEEITMDL